MEGKAWIHEQRDNVYLILVGVFLTGLACSKFLMSLSFILYALFFLFFGDRVLFRKRFINNRGWMIVLLLLLLVHAISLCWSTDIHAGWNALRVRLSFIALPILLATTLNWEKKGVVQLLKGLLILLALLMLINNIRYFYLLEHQQILDIRQLSAFGSHIRFGILVAFSVALCLHLLQHRHVNKLFGSMYLFLATYYVLYSQTFSAIGCLLIIYLYFGALSLKTNPQVRTVFICSFCIGVVVTAFVIRDFVSPLKQCGSFQNAAKASLEWSNKSSMPFFGKDLKGQPIKRTCERYLCSLGKPLNCHEIKQLTKEFIKHIENGYTDPNSAKGSFLGRYYELKYQFQHADDPNGHSLLQRFTYWKTALELIYENPVFGVGIGDVDGELKKAYTKTALRPEFQKRPHNMFLTTWLGCGILGLFLVLGFIFWQLYEGVTKKSWLKAVIMLVLLFSMLLEDSVETQAGASFAGLFIGLLISKEAAPMWSLKND